MIKILFLWFFLYLAYKSIGPIMKIFKIKQSIKKKKSKENFHRKISKMDIQDAEFEET